MTITKITKEGEAKLLSALGQINEMVTEGATPSAAITKVAQADDLPQHQVQLLIQAYNNAKFNRQRATSSLLEEKVAHFKLADPKEIFTALYPNVKEAAAQAVANVVSSDYSLPPARFDKPLLTHEQVKAELEKAAAAVPRPTLQHEPTYHVKKAWSLLKELDVEYEERRMKVAHARDVVDNSFNGLLNYFKQAYHIPFAEVKLNAEALLGPKVGVVMRHLTEENKRL
jgi:hypothetical protein